MDVMVAVVVDELVAAVVDVIVVDLVEHIGCLGDRQDHLAHQHLMDHHLDILDFHQHHYHLMVLVDMQHYQHYLEQQHWLEVISK